jgi:two-component system, NarL family, sensor histidine kinase BarA
MEVRSEPLSLGDLFEGLVSVLKPLSEAKGLSVAASVASDVPIVQTDPTKLQQILYNLLSNAIKFSPNGGRVDLTASMEDETSIRITVTDQGPGIEPEKQAMIFEKFRQIDAGVTRQHGGTGLGLAIAKELSGLLGGTIGVRSIVGEGAAFWVVLPLKISPESKDVRSRMILT